MLQAGHDLCKMLLTLNTPGPEMPMRQNCHMVFFESLDEDDMVACELPPKI